VDERRIESAPGLVDFGFSDHRRETCTQRVAENARPIEGLPVHTEEAQVPSEEPLHRARLQNRLPHQGLGKSASIVPPFSDPKVYGGTNGWNVVRRSNTHPAGLRPAIREAQGRDAEAALRKSTWEVVKEPGTREERLEVGPCPVICGVAFSPGSGRRLGAPRDGRVCQEEDALCQRS